MYDLIRNLPSRKCTKAQNAVEASLLIRHTKWRSAQATISSSIASAVSKGKPDQVDQMYCSGEIER